MCSNCSFAIVPLIHSILPALISDSSWNLVWSMLHFVQPIFRGLQVQTPSCVAFKVYHDLAPSYIFSLNFHYFCLCSQWANQTGNLRPFLQCYPDFPTSVIVPFTEEDLPSALQMKLLHTLKCNSSVAYCRSFLHFPRGNGFYEFWSQLS